MKVIDILLARVTRQVWFYKNIYVNVLSKMTLMIEGRFSVVIRV